MAGQTLTTFANALKKDYHGPIVDALNNQSPLYKVLEKNSDDVEVNGENLQAVVSMKIERNWGSGARAEGGALPSARYVKTLKLAIPLAYNYGAIQFSGQVMKASEASATAFAKVVDTEIKGMVESLKIDSNRQFFGDATGMLCQTNGTGAGASSTVTVDNPGTQLLANGMPIESFAALDSSTQTADSDISEGLTEATSHIVKKILTSTTFMLGDYTGAEIATEKWATNRYITRWGSRANEMMGLRGIIADNTLTGAGSWYGLGDLTSIYYTGDGSTGASRTTYPILNAVINHNSSVNRAISEVLIQGLLDDIDKESGKTQDSKSLVMVCNHAIRANYVDLLQADRRYVKPLELVGGWKAVAYQAGNDEVPIIVDKMALSNAICVLDRRYLRIYRASDYDWMDYDGSMFERVSGVDAYKAVMYVYQNLGCDSFKNQGSLRDISQ